VVHEVEAERVGHDLTRGQAVFTRSRRGPQTADLAATPEHVGDHARVGVVAGQEPDGGSGWGVPGVPAA
jgi:hypothetical protein